MANTICLFYLVNFRLHHYCLLLTLSNYKAPAVEMADSHSPSSDHIQADNLDGAYRDAAADNAAFVVAGMALFADKDTFAVVDMALHLAAYAVVDSALLDFSSADCSVAQQSNLHIQESPHVDFDLEEDIPHFVFGRP